ncbi:hypothetical protein HDU91_006309 [Kappamyces sp. JEL0680]|nr:hypothetical protein HDU91_006309 [Kappamyces sp. JEL0680]
MTPKTRYYLETTDVDARACNISWQQADLAEGSIFKVITSEFPSMKSTDTYQGPLFKTCAENLKPQTKYKICLKVKTSDGSFRQIDECELITTDESALQKAIYNLIRAITESEVLKVSSILKEYGRQINNETRDRQGRTLLMIACQHGDLDITNQLLDRGADPNATTLAGKTPLSIAISYGHLPIVRAIGSKSTSAIDSVDLNGTTMLMHAAEACIVAQRKGFGLGIILYCLENGLRINEEDNKGHTALERLCMTNGSVDGARVLLERGARLISEPNKKHPMTTLMIAALNGHSEICKELMERYGMDPRTKTEVEHFIH